MQSFAVTAASSDISLDATRSADASFTVTNNTALEIRGRGDVVPEGQTQKAWFKLDGESVRTFQPGGTEQYQIHVAVPLDVKAGTYTFQMLMASEANPDEDSTLSSVVSVKVADAPAPKRKIPWLIIIIAAVVIIGAIVVFLLLKGGGAKTVFGPDPFDSPSQFSPNLTVTAPSQEKFLGTPNGSGFSQGFSNDTATLTLQDLPKHTQVTVNFDLYVLASWDGNRLDAGPDFWAFGFLQDGLKQFQIQTTFSNTPAASPAATQCFPVNCDPAGPFVMNPAGTGGEAIALNFPSQFGGLVDVPARVYHLTRTFSQSGPNLTLFFAGGVGAGGPALQGAVDEAWGLDNVEVQVK
jgi:hypothetical protein